MNSSLFSKFAALAIALAGIGTMLIAVAVSFSSHARAESVVVAQGSSGLGFFV